MQRQTEERVVGGFGGGAREGGVGMTPPLRAITRERGEGGGSPIEQTHQPNCVHDTQQRSIAGWISQGHRFIDP